MATHSSILARKIPRTVHWGRKELDKTEHMHTHTHTHTQILGLAVDGVESSHGSHQRRAHTHTQISGLAVDGVESSQGSHQRHTYTHAHAQILGLAVVVLNPAMAHIRGLPILCHQYVSLSLL